MKKQIPPASVRSYLSWLREMGALSKESSRIYTGALIKHIIDEEGISVSQASNKIKKLSGKGYIDYEDFEKGHKVWLTRKGKELLDAQAEKPREKREEVKELTKKEKEPKSIKEKRGKAKTRKKIKKEAPPAKQHISKDKLQTKEKKFQKRENHEETPEPPKKHRKPPYPGFKRHLRWLKNKTSNIGYRDFCGFIEEDKDISFPKANKLKTLLEDEEYIQMSQTERGTEIELTRKGKNVIGE